MKRARLGDAGSHGGVIITASPDTSANGLAVARVGDLYGCPQHGPNPIITGSTTGVRVNGKMVAIVGSKTACGAVITEGSADVYTDS